MNNDMFYKGMLAELNKIADVIPVKRPWYKNPAVWGGIGLAGLGGYGAYKMLGQTAPVDPPVDNHVPLAEGTRDIMDAAYGKNLISGSPEFRSTPPPPSMLSSALHGAGKLGLQAVKNNPVIDTAIGSAAVGSVLKKPLLGRLGGVAADFGGQMLYDGAVNPADNSLANRGLELGVGAGATAANIVGKKNVAAGLLKLAPKATNPAAAFAAKRMALQGAKSLVGMPLKAGMRFVPGVGWAYTAGAVGQEAMSLAGNAADSYVNNPSDLVLADRLKTISQGLNSQDNTVLNNSAVDARNLFTTDWGNKWRNNTTHPGVWATMGAGGVPNRAPLINDLDKVKNQYEQTVANKHLQLPPVDPRYNYHEPPNSANPYHGFNGSLMSD